MRNFFSRFKKKNPATELTAAGSTVAHTVTHSMSDEEFAGYVAERARRMDLVSQMDAGPSTP